MRAFVCVCVRAHGRTYTFKLLLKCSEFCDQDSLQIHRDGYEGLKYQAISIFQALLWISLVTGWFFFLLLFLQTKTLPNAVANFSFLCTYLPLLTLDSSPPLLSSHLSSHLSLIFLSLSLFSLMLFLCSAPSICTVLCTSVYIVLLLTLLLPVKLFQWL